MVEEPMILRGYHLNERLCMHGVEHADPDSLAHMKRLGIEGMDQHSCVGCCGKLA
jgi:hypothetical protein